MRVRMRPTLLGATALLALWACNAEPPDGEFRPLYVADRELLSVNDRCPVMDDRLSEQVEPLYVNGRPLGFC